MLKRVVLAVLAAAPALGAQSSIAAVADTVFAPWNSSTRPGCAVGVARDGKNLLEKAYGMANLETGTPNTAETVFESGSVAKQFTATAVVLLAMDGKLNVDDPVTKYLPEFPRYDRPILIRHLLTHTSGLRDWSNLVAAAGWPRGQREHTQADLLDILYRQRSLNYPVGDFYSYTNSGFAVLMSLVERVSGQSFQDFTRERIFKPLGMTHTHWRTDFRRLEPGRAQAYAPLRNDEWQLDMPFEDVVGPGGLLTTVGDWLIWNEALTHNTLHSGHADSLTQRMHLTSGRRIPYAFGIIVDDYRGIPEIAHSGSTGGYSTYLARYPDRGLSIAILCNVTLGNATLYTHELADRLITDFPAAPRVDTSAVNMATFAKVEGVYRNDRTHAPYQVNASLAPTLRAMPDGSYRQKNGARLLFDAHNGRPATLRVIATDGDTVHYTWMSAAPWKPTATDLKAFEGSYHSDEVGATYRVRVSGDTLTYSTRPGVALTARPAYTDAFARGGSTVWFTRDRNGRVTAMHFGEARMWDLVLARIP